MIAQKQRVRVTLDLEVYDDLDLHKQDWHNILDLEGNEDVYVSIEYLDVDY